MNDAVKQVTAVTLACAVILLVTVAWLDRPLALLVHQHLPATRWLRLLAAPGAITTPLSTACVLLMGAAAACGWRPGPLAWSILTGAMATLLAFALKEQFKLAFGRTWPETWTGENPSFLQNHVFGFWPFHGGEGWAAFPSGHTTVVAAPAAVLWQLRPALRWLAASLVAMVAVGLLSANYHWLSDVLGGAMLGVAAGRGTVVLLAPRARRQQPASPDQRHPGEQGAGGAEPEGHRERRLELVGTRKIVVVGHLHGTTPSVDD